MHPLLPTVRPNWTLSTILKTLSTKRGTPLKEGALGILPVIPYGEKTRPGRCPEQELIAQRPLMINQAREVFCQGRFPASLIYVLIVGPWPAVPSTFMPLPFRSTSAVPPSRSRHRTAPMFLLVSGREGNKIRLSLP